MKNVNLMFFTVAIVSPILILSTSSWLISWMFLELSSISFLIIISSKKNNKINETSLKYFLIQSTASCILLMALFFYNVNEYTSKSMSVLIINTIMIISLIIKLGGAPFQFWLIPMSIKLTWKELAMLLTWQKISPLILMTQQTEMKLLTLMGTLSILWATFSQLNVMSTKIILSYSSISHLGWMMVCLVYSNMMSMFYFFIYFVISIPLMIYLSKSNMNSLSHQNSNLSMNNILLSMLSLAGIPPLLGFMSKWMVLMNLSQSNKSIMLMTMMVIMSIITFYFYIRITFAMLFKLNQIQNIWMMKPSYLKINVSSNLMLPALFLMAPK